MNKEELMNKYLEKKDFYISEHFNLDYGFNASWALDLPMGEMGYKDSDWYTPGLLEIYREDNAWKIHSMNIVSLYKEKGIDYTLDVLEEYTKQLKKVLFTDIKNTPRSNISEVKQEGLNRIIVLIYESENIWKTTIGFKYSYFFIREEMGLDFFSMVYEQNIIEGTLEELKDKVSSKRNIVSEFDFYLKWDWS